MTMTAEITNRNKVAKGINNILCRKPGTTAQVFLFGSRARGDAHSNSDWDILILLDKDRITSEDMDTISYPIRELGWELDEMLNPIMYTKKEWEAKNFTPFYKNVMKEGIPL